MFVVSRLRGGGSGASRPAQSAEQVSHTGKTLMGQKKVLAEASAQQEKVAAAAKRAWPWEKAKRRGYHDYGTRTLGRYAYQKYGLCKLEPLLAHITLIDVNYLIALGEAGGVVPRWQDVPIAARIDATSLWRLRRFRGFPPIIVLSYPWLDRHHPDKHGAGASCPSCERPARRRRTRSGVVPTARCASRPRPAPRALSTRAPAAAQFGVFWDYMSLPQGADRSKAEYARFKEGLAAMTGFYVHPYTRVLSMRTPIPEGDYENTRPYEERGCAAPRHRPAGPRPAHPPVRLRWCHFELRIASIVKFSNCLWDLSLHTEGAAITWCECLKTLKSTRPPLTSPEQMTRELREKKFTNDADLKQVASLYEQGFVRAFNTFMRQDADGSVSYAGLGWGTAEMPTLVAALEYAEAHCRPTGKDGKEDVKLTLRLFHNKFTDAENARLRAAVPGCSTKFEVKAFHCT